MVLSSDDKFFFKISFSVVVVFSNISFGNISSVKLFRSRSCPSGLIWVLIVCKSYQQTTLVSKVFMTTIQAIIRELTRNSKSGIYIKLQEHQIFACLSYFADKLCQQSKPSSG